MFDYNVDKNEKYYVVALVMYLLLDIRAHLHSTLHQLLEQAFVI